MFVRNLNPIGITESPAKQNFAFAPSIQFTFVLKREQYYAAKVLLIVISKRIIFEGFFFGHLNTIDEYQNQNGFIFANCILNCSIYWLICLLLA